MAHRVNRHQQKNNGSDCNLGNLITSNLILWETFLYIQIHVTVMLSTYKLIWLLCIYPPNVTISCPAMLSNHQSLLSNHLPINVFSKPHWSFILSFSLSDRRGRTCVVFHSGAGRLGTLKYNSFRWRSIRMFYKLPKAIHMLSSCSVVGFKSQLDLTPISGTLWIFPASLDTIIVWTVGIGYMVVTTQMT